MLVIYIYYIRPASAQLVQTKSEVVAAQVTLSDLSQKVEELKKLQENVPSSTAEQQSLLAKIPPEVDQDGLIEDVSSLAASRGIELKNIGFSLGQVDEKLGVGVITMSTGFTGTYQDLVALLTDLERNTRILRVKNIAVQVHEVTRSASAQVSFTLTIESYYQAK
mgnify:FL=1